MNEMTPADIALRDQAIAETADDLANLVSHASRLLIDHDPDEVTDGLVGGLLNEPSWERLELCSVLGLAITWLAVGGIAEKKPIAVSGRAADTEGRQG